MYVCFICMGLMNDCIDVKFLELKFLCKLIKVTALDHFAAFWANYIYLSALLY